MSRPTSFKIKSLLLLTLSIFIFFLLSRAQRLPHEFPLTHTHNFTSLTPHNYIHAYRPPREGDSRAPCPALNTLANHGYLPHNGKNIRPSDLVDALREAYHLSTPLANFLTYGGYFLLRNPPLPTTPLTASPPSTFAHILHTLKSLPSLPTILRPLDLSDLALHNHIEHDASLVHDNTPSNHTYAPTSIDPALLAAFLATPAPSSPHFSLTDIAAARVTRERAPHTAIDAMHAEVARGEVALVLGIFGAAPTDVANIHGPGVPVDLMRAWFGDERLPEGWAPKHQQTLLGTIKISSGIRAAMNHIRAQPAPPVYDLVANASSFRVQPNDATVFLPPHALHLPIKMVPDH